MYSKGMGVLKDDSEAGKLMESADLGHVKATKAMRRCDSSVSAVYPGSQCDEVEACTLDVGRKCAAKYLKSEAQKRSAMDTLDRYAHEPFDENGCTMDSADDGLIMSSATPAVQRYLKCVANLGQQKENLNIWPYKAACWTHCPMPCGDSDPFVEIDVYEECKDMCQIARGCIAINEGYFFNPVIDATYLALTMVSGCKDHFHNPTYSRLYKGSPERLRLKEALRDPNSKESKRLKKLMLSRMMRTRTRTRRTSCDRSSGSRATRSLLISYWSSIEEPQAPGNAASLHLSRTCILLVSSCGCVFVCMQDGKKAKLRPK